jgi:uncharacterized damage-inducible protein DinB
MGHELRDLARHNSWATARIVDFCKGLDQKILNSKVPGTYGSIFDTVRHIIDSEASYLYRSTGAWSELPWRYDDPVDLDVLAERAVLLAGVFEEFVSRKVNIEATGVATNDDGTVYAVPVGIFITQIIYHANEHRSQVCSTLGSLGVEPPNLSAWEFSFATGRSTVTSPPPE